MVYRFSWLIAFTSLGFSFFLLDDLVRGTSEGTPWHILVMAAILLGGLLTWAMLAVRAPTWLVVAVNLIALTAVATRVLAPESAAVIIPIGDAWAAAAEHIEFARDIIRRGVAPVIPATGLVAVLVALYWALAATIVWGLERHHPFIAVLPPLVLALQFATMDRAPTGGSRITIFLVLMVLSLLAVSADERDHGAGRLTRPGVWEGSRLRLVSPLWVASLVVVLVGTLATTALAGGLVPASGTLTWRASSGISGNYFGGVAYNPFIDIRRKLVAQTEIPVFTAALDGGVDPTAVYYRLVTMDTFNGGQWYAGNRVRVADPADRWERGDQSFTGPTTTIRQTIEIRELVSEWLPAAYVPTEIAVERDVAANLLVADDGSLLYAGGLTSRGMPYIVTSEVPLLDLRRLATAADGSLSPAFVLAGEDGLEVDPAGAVEPRAVPDDERYTELPDDLDPRIGELAAGIVRNLGTNFERGLALEAFFREPDNGFVYTTEVTPGHGADDLAEWLLDADADGYRAGYCEQYATSMGVLARAAGIPARVVLGFTPGEPIGDGVVVVRDRNAHAWVEIWVETQGWIRFDPTPRGDGVNPATMSELPFNLAPYLDVPDPDLDPADAAPDLIPGEFGEFVPFPIGLTGGEDDPVDRGLPAWFGEAAVGALVILALLAALPLVKLALRRRRLARLRKGDIGAAWEDIVARLSDLGEPPSRAWTPLETADRVDDALRPLARVYSTAVYGPAGSTPPDAARTAADSLTATRAVLAERYPRRRRILAWYRPGTVVRRRRRRNGRT